jgi:Protein of unknown function (DUF3108)
MTPPKALPSCRPFLLPLAWILVLAASPASSPDSASSGAGTGTTAAVPAVAEPDPAQGANGRGGSTTAGLAAVPWKIGEYFQFSIDWNGLNGGNSLMQVQNLTRVDGRRAYRVVMKAESNSFVSKFYKVRDRAETFIDAESLYTRRFIKRLREGGYEKDIDVRFDQEARKARYTDGETFDVPSRVHDVLSAFYYVRTVPLPTGASISLPTHDNKKSYEMVVKVHRRERVEVPAGKFDCVVVEPILKSEGVFKSKGSIEVWLTDDARRIPVLVKSKIPIGSISVSLTDMRLAFQGGR